MRQKNTCFNVNLEMLKLLDTSLGFNSEHEWESQSCGRLKKRKKRTSLETLITSPSLHFDSKICVAYGKVSS
jgi:hypothetical protein